MSSFVNDNVSESKKHEQQITKNQETSEESSTTAKNNQTKNEATTTAAVAATLSSNDNKVNKTIETLAATDNENTNITIIKNENKSENNLITSSAKNYDNKSNNDIVNDTTAIDKNNDKNKDNNVDDVVAIAIDNNQNLNKTDDNKLTTATVAAASTSASVTHKSTSPLIVETDALSAATCCVSKMTPGDVEQQQQQQVASVDDKQNPTTPIANINVLPPSPTSTIPESNTDYEDTITSTSNLLIKVNKTQDNNRVSDCNVNPTTTTTTSPLPPLPQGLTSPIAGSHIPHISSEPTFGVKLRNKNLEDQQKNNNSNNSGSSRNWRSDTSAPNCSSVIKSGTVSASVSPSMVRKSSDSAVLIPRRVSFPKSDNELVTGYLEPANPWEHGK